MSAPPSPALHSAQVPAERSRNVELPLREALSIAKPRTFSSCRRSYDSQMSEGACSPALHSELQNSLCFDSAGLLRGESVLVTAQGMGGARHGMAVADVIAPSSSSTPLPVQVDVTNYRLRFCTPEITGAILNATVCCGHGLPNRDRGNPPDPCALVSLTGCQHRSMSQLRITSVKTKTSDPVWNEAFSFEGVTDQANLRVQIFDGDVSKAEAYMGEVRIQHVARLPTNCQSLQRHWAVTMNMQHGNLDLDPCNRGHGLGAIRLLLRCAWPVPGFPLGSLSFPLMCIEKVQLDTKTQVLSVTTKATEQFSIAFDTARDAREIHQVLTTEPRSIDGLLCMSPLAEPRHGAHLRFSCARELARWTTQEGTAVRKASPAEYSRRWRVDREANSAYELCRTYPQEVILPSNMPLTTLRASASFRVKQRFPMISWVHPNNGAVLVRCSQPMVGVAVKVTPNRKLDHECLMAFLSGECRELSICDARAYKTAQVNRATGGGSESTLHYESCNIQFLCIKNIHTMREALQGLRAAVCQQDDFNMYAGSLANWLNHVRSLIRGANTVAELVESGMSVVVHCSDGWDRTSQIVSLASVLLDGYYRTIAGLIDLIQKDWLQPGHKFRDRHNLSRRADQSQHQNDMSPIFMQFLDAMTQIWMTYPRHFEYTPTLLAFLLYHSLSGRYSTFLGNCELERQDLGLPERGSCLWAEIMSSAGDWLNKSYDEDIARTPIVPCTIPLQQHGFSRELYESFSSWWSNEQRVTWGISSLSNRSELMMESKPSVARTFVATPGGKRENGGYIFCSSRLNINTRSEMLACELLLRKFMDVISFPAQPDVRVVSHSNHGRLTQFVIEMASTDGEECHFVTKRYNEFDALRIALQEQVSLEVPAPFPPKIFFGTGCTAIKLTKRMVKLDAWLRAVISCVWVLPQEAPASMAERCHDMWMHRFQSVFAF